MLLSTQLILFTTFSTKQFWIPLSLHIIQADKRHLYFTIIIGPINNIIYTYKKRFPSMQKAVNMGDLIKKCNYSVMSPVFFHFTYSRSEADLDKEDAVSWIAFQYNLIWKILHTAPLPNNPYFFFNWRESSARSCGTSEITGWPLITAAVSAFLSYNWKPRS